MGNYDWNKRRKFKVAKRLAKLGIKHPYRLIRKYLDFDHFGVVEEIEQALSRIEKKGGKFHLECYWYEYLGDWDYCRRYRLEDKLGVVLEN